MNLGWVLVLLAGAGAGMAGGAHALPPAVVAQSDLLPRLDVPYVPTQSEVVAEMLKLADLNQDDVLYDLGCGDGRLVITAAQKFGARGIGVDIDPERIEESERNAKQAGVTGRVKFFEQDLFRTDLREATAVTLYLFPDVNVRLRPKLLRELKPGTPVISNEFNMGEWEADRVLRVQAPDRIYVVYYWLVPAHAEGTWQWRLPSPTGPVDYTLQLRQQFQKVSGTATVNGKAASLTDVQLSGNQLNFTIQAQEQTPTVRFNGHLSGDSIRGTASGLAANKSEDWKADRTVRLAPGWVR